MSCFCGDQGAPPAPPAGGTPTNPNSTVAGCCPTAVTIKAPDGTSPPCQLVPANGSLQLRAVPQPATGSGRHFRWTTGSAKIRLDQADQETVTVVGLANASASRNAEYPPAGNETHWELISR